jgi:hypothetical protein
MRWASIAKGASPCGDDRIDVRNRAQRLVAMFWRRRFRPAGGPVMSTTRRMGGRQLLGVRGRAGSRAGDRSRRGGETRGDRARPRAYCEARCGGSSISRSSASRSMRIFRTGSWTRGRAPASINPRTVHVDRPRYSAACRRPRSLGSTFGTRAFRTSDRLTDPLFMRVGEGDVPGTCLVSTGRGCFRGRPGRPGPRCPRIRSLAPGRITAVPMSADAEP